MKEWGWDSLERLDPSEIEKSVREAEEFFRLRRERPDEAEFRRLLDREGGEPPQPEDSLD